MVYPGDCKEFEMLEYEILKAEWIGKNMKKYNRDKIIEELIYNAKGFFLLSLFFIVKITSK